MTRAWNTILVGLAVAACQQAAAPSESSVEQALDTAPTVSSFVLYADRSIRLGAHDDASGNVGVAIGAAPSFGPQVVLADHISAGDLYAPSVLLGDHSSAHDIGVNMLGCGSFTSRSTGAISIT